MARLFPKDNSDFDVTISNHTLLRTLAFAAGAVLLYWAITKSAHSLSLIGIAFFLTLALNAPVRWVARHLPGKMRGNRNLAAGVSIGIVVLLLAGFLFAIVPPLAKQTTNFVRGMPQLIQDTRDQNTPVGSFVRRHNLEGQIDKFSAQLSDRLNSIGSSAVNIVSKVGSSIVSALTVLVLVIMMLLEGPHWKELFERLVPPHDRPRIERLGREMSKVIQGYVNGQVTLAAIAALLIVPVLFIMGVSYPVALMVIVFICGLIPMVGHTIGAVICTTVALFTSLPAALVVLGYYILYQQIENYAVQPRIQANSTNMSPLLVFVAVILGANFGGLLGALVAIPIAGCIRIIVLDYLERRDILSAKTVRAIKSE
jgi:predicted PurR-regulated permease PerM